MERSAEFDVIVIGAGVAGLAAARKLAEAHLRVALLEARERVGGRIYTVASRQGNLPVELGAEFIHGQPPGLLELVGEAGLTPVELKGRSRCFLKKEGGFQPQPCSDFGETFAMLDRMAQDPLLRETDLSFDEFLARRGIVGQPAIWARNYVEGFNAADAGRISARALAKQQAAEDATSGDRTFRVLEGYARIAEYLLNRFREKGGEFYLATRVESVDWRAGSVEASCRSSHSSVKFRGRAGIVTLPLGVLQQRRVGFTPLPEAIFAAVDRLAMGRASRLVYEFDLNFCKGLASVENTRFLFAPGAPLPTWWTTHPIRSGQLTGWFGGGHVDHPDPASLFASSEGPLASILDRSPSALRSHLLRWQGHDWQQDPFSLGAYSYVPTGALGTPENLAQPVEGTLFFAGEHTDTGGHWGTVHAALGSGYRAARQLLALSASASIE